MNVRKAVSTFRGHRVPHLDIIGRRNIWFMISGATLVLALIGLLFSGLKFSIDFSGGAILRFANASGATIGDYQDALGKFGLKDSTVEFINGNEVQIRTEKSLTAVSASPTPSGTATSPTTSPSTTASASPTATASASGTAGPTPSASATASPPVITTASPPAVQSLVGNEVRESLAAVAGISTDDIDEQDVGPTWGSQISAKAFQGLLIFLVLVAVYISARFEPKMAGAALIALAHDLIITAGIYALVGREVTPAAVIAILTILGYSLYDTVVIFDKIKENTDNAALIARETYGSVVNMSLNQTLMRSVNTSLVVLLPIGSLLLFGGSTLKDFAFALFVGVASGTYSSIFVASPILVLFKEREPRYQQLRARHEQRVARQAPRAAPKSTVRAVAGNGAGAVPGAVAPSRVGSSGSSTAMEATGSSTTAPASRPPSGQRSGSSAKKKTGGKPKPKRRRR